MWIKVCNFFGFLKSKVADKDNNIKHHGKILAYYCFLLPTIELYAGHLTTFLMVALIFLMEGVQENGKGKSVSSVTSGISCSDEENLKQIHASCCGSHMGSWLGGMFLACCIYASGNPTTTSLAFAATLGTWLLFIYVDSMNAGKEKTPCFQLDWHASWLLQGCILLLTLFILTNPYFVNVHHMVSVKVAALFLFLFYTALMMAVYKYITEENTNVATTSAVVVSAIAGIVVLLSTGRQAYRSRKKSKITSALNKQVKLME
jgi:hypothetical protein